MNPKLPLNGYIYIHAYCRQGLNHQCVSDQFKPAFVQSQVTCSHLSLFLKWTTLTAKIIAQMGGAHSWVEAYIASPTFPPYDGKQLTVLFHTQSPFTTLVHRCTATTINCIFWLKPSPALKASGHQLGLVYGHETWAYPTNTGLATMAFLLLLDTNLLSEADITSWYTLY